MQIVWEGKVGAWEREEKRKRLKKDRLSSQILLWATGSTPPGELWNHRINTSKFSYPRGEGAGSLSPSGRWLKAAPGVTNILTLPAFSSLYNTYRVLY